MFPLLLFYIVVATEDKVSLERRVFFHEETKRLVAEEIVGSQFLVPFPQFDPKLTKSLDQIATEFQNTWRMPTYCCYLTFSNTSENDLGVDWLMKETKKEISLANEDLKKI